MLEIETTFIFPFLAQKLIFCGSVRFAKSEKIENYVYKVQSFFGRERGVWM